MASKESYILRFPIKGLVETSSYQDQPPFTAVRLQNVRAFDADTDRARGGKRPGLSKWSAAQVNGGHDVQDILSVVSSAAYAASNQSISVRSFKTLALAGGVLKLMTPSAATAPGTGTGTFVATAPVVFSAELFGVVYYCDGTNYSKYTVASDTAAAWTAAAGSLPSSGSNVCRLIELWNGRIVLAGLVGDDHNWFMSKQGDATDWDYAPDPTTEQDAVAGNNSLLGKIGDVINGIVPYNDDILLFLGDHTIWQVSGDPMAGGRIDRVSDITGGAWGRAWCKDPYGRVWFYGSRGGVYRMVPGQAPERISSHAVESRMRRTDLSRHLVRMAWSDEEQGVYVWMVPTVDASVADNYFYDVRTEGWFVDVYANPDHYPRVVHVFDADDPNDRAILLGCKDGYIRRIDQAAKNDDGTPITSYAMIGPIRPRGKTAEFLIDQIEVTLGWNSDGADGLCRLWVGDTEEDALSGAEIEIEGLLTESGEVLICEQAADPKFTMDLEAGRSVTHHPRVRGYAGYVEIFNDDLYVRWSLERVECRLKVLGSKR